VRILGVYGQAYDRLAAAKCGRIPWVATAIFALALPLKFIGFAGHDDIVKLHRQQQASELISASHRASAKLASNSLLGFANVGSQRERYMSHCPHCNRNSFEIDEIEVAGKKYHFMQCSECKSPIGVIEAASFDLTEVLRVLVASLQKLNARLERIEQSLGNGQGR
jgi:hypothetical protein